MSGLHEGGKVSYVGDGSDGRQVGETGRLLVTSGREGHVRWERDGAITPHQLDFLVPALGVAQQRAAARRDELADSLAVGQISMTSVRTTYEAEGSHGVLNTMAAHGALSSFPEIARDALSLVAARISEDPSVRQYLASLDEEESAEVVGLASHALLRDAFGDADG